eukprot:2181603-Rhodomonas_salina.1
MGINRPALRCTPSADSGDCLVLPYESVLELVGPYARSYWLWKICTVYTGVGRYPGSVLAKFARSVRAFEDTRGPSRKLYRVGTGVGMMLRIHQYQHGYSGTGAGSPGTDASKGNPGSSIAFLSTGLFVAQA